MLVWAPEWKAFREVHRPLASRMTNQKKETRFSLTMEDFASLASLADEDLETAND